MAFLERLRECKIDLFLHQQGLDTTTSSGRAMFGMLSVFAEFERRQAKFNRYVDDFNKAMGEFNKSNKTI